MTTGPGVDLRGAAEELLTLGRDGAGPAGAVVGVLADGVESVAAAGHALAPSTGTPAGEGRGAARRGATRAMATDTRVDIASVTKVASTTALVMQLVAEGRLDLDAPVAEHLPHFTAPHRTGSHRTGGTVTAPVAVAASGPGAAVTPRHLLAHTSGLPAWLPLYCRTTVRDEALRLAATTPLVAEPGTVRRYSDLGMIVLGAVVEAVTRQRQDVAFAQRVAGPLGLHRTAYGPVPADQAAASADSDVVEHQMVTTGEPYPTGDRTTDFAGWRTGTVIGEANDGNAAHALGGVAGHAGLFTTVPELLALGRSLVDTGRFPEALVRAFTTPQPAAPGQGLGFWLETKTVAGQAIPMAVHAGFTGTWLGIALDRDLVVAAVATRLHTTTGTLDAPRTRREGLVGTSEIASVVLSHLGAAQHHQTGAP